MRMAGVADSYSPAEAAVMALKAGCDILLYSGMGEVEEAAVRAVHEAVARGELSEERIYASAERIVAAKKRLVRERPSVDLAAHADLARQVSRKAVTLRRDRAGLIPLPVGNVTVIEVTRRAITQVEEQLQETGLRAQLADFLPAAQHLAAPANPDALTIEQVLRAARGDVAVVVTQDAWRHGGQQDLLRRLVARYPQRIIHVAGRLPYDVDLVPEVPTALCIYDTVTPSIRAFLKYLPAASSLPATCRKDPAHGHKPFLRRAPLARCRNADPRRHLPSRPLVARTGVEAVLVEKTLEHEDEQNHQRHGGNRRTDDEKIEPTAGRDGKGTPSVRLRRPKRSAMPT